MARLAGVCTGHIWPAYPPNSKQAQSNLTSILPHMARLWPVYLKRHGPFLARLVFSNEKACLHHDSSMPQRPFDPSSTVQKLSTAISLPLPILLLFQLSSFFLLLYPFLYFVLFYLFLFLLLHIFLSFSSFFSSSSYSTTSPSPPCPPPALPFFYILLVFLHPPSPPPLLPPPPFYSSSSYSNSSSSPSSTFLPFLLVFPFLLLHRFLLFL